MIYLYIVLGIIALLMVIMLVPLRLHIEYHSRQLQLELWVLKLKFDLNKYLNKPKKVKKQKTPAEGMQDKQLGTIQKINNLYKKIVYLKKVYTASSKTVNKGIVTEKISADINFGFSDAAVTGMVTGVVWSLMYEMLGLLSIVTTVKDHSFNVDAVYDRFVFEPKASITLKTSILNVFKILISVLYNLKKYKE